jgi:flotillin
MRYYIASATEYLVITGAGIDDLRICKKALVYPWQKVRTVMTLQLRIATDDHPDFPNLGHAL